MSIREQIEFQIGSFRSATGNQAGSDIHIYPFEDFEATDNDLVHYTSKAQVGEYWCDPESSLAIQSHSNNFSVYTDSGFNINWLLQSILLDASASFIHAAGIASNGQGTIFSGAGGVGKTGLLGEFVNKEEYNILGDDLVIINESSEMYSFPRQFVLKEYHQDVYPDIFEKYDLNRADTISQYRGKLIDIIIENAPFMGLTKYILKKSNQFDTAVNVVSNLTPGSHLATVPIEEIYSEESIVSEATLQRTIFLQRYEGKTLQIEKVNSELLARKMSSIILSEWKKDLHILLELGAINMVNIPIYIQGTYNIIKSSLEDIPCFSYKIPKNATSSEMYEYLKDSDVL